MQQFPTMLRPFVHPVACCWELLRKHFETGQTLSACKQTQQFPTMLASCWPTIARPFAHPVACCCIVWSCCAKFETDQTLSYAQTVANIPNNVASVCSPCCTLLCCWELLRKVWNRSNFKLRANRCNNSQQCWRVVGRRCCVCLHVIALS